MTEYRLNFVLDKKQERDVRNFQYNVVYPKVFDSSLQQIKKYISQLTYALEYLNNNPYENTVIDEFKRFTKSKLEDAQNLYSELEELVTTGEAVDIYDIPDEHRSFKEHYEIFQTGLGQVVNYVCKIEDKEYKLDITDYSSW